MAHIPARLARLAEHDGLKGALVSINAVATNAAIAQAIRNAGAHRLPAAKNNRPTLRAAVEACFADAPQGTVNTDTTHDKGHGRIESRTTSVVRDVDWLDARRRFPGELRLPDAACIVRVRAHVGRGGKAHEDTHFHISSVPLDAALAGHAVRGHWRIENQLHWAVDVTFNDDQSRLRKGHGARNMAVVRHFPLNLVRTASGTKSIKLRRKMAGSNPDYLPPPHRPRPANLSPGPCGTGGADCKGGQGGQRLPLGPARSLQGSYGADQ